MADDNNLAAAVSESDGGTSAGPAAAPAVPDVSGAPPAVSSTSNLGGAIQPSTPDLPRFQRTFGNTLKGMLLGFGLGGIPGAVEGGISPRGIENVANAQRQATQAKLTFANAQAAHEVAMAHQADVEYQALPEKLQQEAETRGLANMAEARKAGYLPVASIPLDHGTAQNAQGAMTALNSVKQQFGAVPSGLLYIHTGSGVTVMKLQDPAAALTTINQARRAQGMPEINQDAFLQLNPADRDSMARDAINFTDPRDTNGQVTQNSINLATMRLATVKAQPEFNGKDALVTALQQTVDHQKAVLDSGAVAEATRKGQAAGAEAQAAEPGQTAAQVANIKATAGPAAAAAGEKAGAEEAAKFPYELKLKQAEKDQDQGFAVNPKTGQRELVGKADAKDQGFTNWTKAGQPDIEKETQLNSQLNELQLNTSRYKVALQEMGELSQQDVNHMARILSDPDVHSGIAANVGMGSVLSIIEKGSRAKDWNELSPDKQEALMGALRMRNSALLFQKVATGIGRASKEAMDIELQNMPDPYEGATVGLKKLGVFQENVDQMASRSVKLPWMESSTDIKQRVEGQPRSGNAAPQGKYKSAQPVKEGQNIQLQNIPGLSIVRKVYPDGTFDADQKGQ